MSTDVWPADTGRLVFEALDSTNAEAGRRAGGLAGPAWIMARRQTAGRGRQGRTWADPPGNFAASLVTPLPAERRTAALRSFATALALYEAVETVAGSDAPLALKWPNDLLLDRRKLAGILLESAGDHLIVGVGVNLLAAPPARPGSLAPVSLLAVTGRRVAPESLLDRLAPAYARREAELCAQGFAPLRRAWLDRAAGVGHHVVARTMRETIEGRFATVDETGALVLETASGRRAIPAAEVFF